MKICKENAVSRRSTPTVAGTHSVGSESFFAPVELFALFLLYYKRVRGQAGRCVFDCFFFFLFVVFCALK